MNVMKLLVLFVIGILSVTGCRKVPASGPPQTPTPIATPEPGAYWKITAQEAKALLDKDHAHIITLVDVRTAEEYREKRIANSLLLPVSEITKLAPTMLPDKDAMILLYCRSGRRSREAATTLVAMGYTYIYMTSAVSSTGRMRPSLASKPSVPTHDTELLFKPTTDGGASPPSISGQWWTWWSGCSAGRKSFLERVRRRGYAFVPCSTRLMRWRRFLPDG